MRFLDSLTVGINGRFNDAYTLLNRTPAVKDFTFA